MSVVTRLSDPPLVYLAGEIHTGWRDELATACEDRGLAVRFAAPIEDHDASDGCGAKILGDQGTRRWNDILGAGINGVRRRTLLAQSDVVVVRFAAAFGEWNGAFDAGFAAAQGKPVITLHPPELDHALKEVNQACFVSTQTTEQLASVLAYAFSDLRWTTSHAGALHASH